MDFYPLLESHKWELQLIAEFLSHDSVVYN